MSDMELQLHVQRPGFALDVDLRLPGQGVTTLFGPSGCGKTTLLRAVAGLERARPGRVLVRGQIWQDDTQDIWQPTHQRALGYVFQEASLFHHLSVRRNIEYGLNRTPAARRQIVLEQAVDLLGIAPLLERATATLSGGERRHPRGKCHAGIGTLQFGNRVFGACHGGVVQARIDRVGGIVLAANQRIKTGPRHIEIGDRVGGG